MSKAINISKMTFLPACSCFYSKQNDVLFLYLGGIFPMDSIPEGKNVILAGKKAQGQTGPMALNDTGIGKEAL